MPLAVNLPKVSRGNLFLKVIDLIDISSIMFKWIKECYKDWCEVQKELNDMGIFHTVHHLGNHTHVDKEQFKKYLNDSKHRTISEDDRQTKV
jgi:hypothetical protein